MTLHDAGPAPRAYRFVPRHQQRVQQPIVPRERIPASPEEVRLANLRASLAEKENILNRREAILRCREERIRSEEQSLAKERARVSDLRAAHESIVSSSSKLSRYYISEIVDAACIVFDITKTDLLSTRRTARPVLARQVAFYVARKLTQNSLPEIGRRFGGRDHTTVLHGVNRITETIHGGCEETAGLVCAVTDLAMSRHADAVKARVSQRDGLLAGIEAEIAEAGCHE